MAGHPRAPDDGSGAMGASVTAFGATGDGVTDDTEAVQAAIDRGGITRFPPGEYRCGTLTARTASRLAGVNSGSYSYRAGAYVSAYPAGTVSRIVRRPGTNAPLLVGPTGATHVIVQDLELDGNNRAQTGGSQPVLCLPDSVEPEDTQWTISRCYVHGRTDPRSHDWGSGGSNIYLGGGRMACRVLHTVSTYAHRHGVEINGADTLVDGCIIGDNGAHGIVVGAWATTITGCAVFNNGDGIHVPHTGTGAPKRVIITANGIDRNRRDGIRVDGTAASGAAGVSITDNGFTSNSTAADGTGAHVAVLTTTGHVVLGGNVFSVLEQGYPNRTSEAVRLGPGATALDIGNVYEGGAIHGYTNDPDALYRRTRGS